MILAVSFVSFVHEEWLPGLGPIVVKLYMLFPETVRIFLALRCIQPVLDRFLQRQAPRRACDRSKEQFNHDTLR